MSDLQKRKTTRTPLRLSLVLVAGLTLAGCEEAAQQNVEGLMQRAIELRDAGEIRGAIIELKNVLRNDPKSAEARLLLANIYIGVGDGASAEKEAKQARELGAKPLDVIQSLGKSLLLQNQPQKILEQFPIPNGSSAAVETVLRVLRGEANLMLRKSGEAEKNFEKAVAAYRKDINEERPHLKITEPAESIDAIVGLVKVYMDRKEWKRALAKLDQARQLGSERPEVFAVTGAYELAQNNFKQAEEAYGAAFTARPYNAKYQIRIAISQLGQGKNKEAIENLDAVLKAFPNHILSNYLRALAAYRLRDYESARGYTETVLKFDSNNIPAYLIAGGASYALGQLEQANRYLSLYLAAVPGNYGARKLLSATQLRLGRAGTAIETLRPISDAKSDDVSLLSMIGTAAVASGDLSTGREYLRRASEARPEDAKLKARSAILQIALGKTDSGLRDLEDAVGRDTNLGNIEAQLILTYIKEKKFDKAITAAQRLQDRQPDKTAGFILEGLAEFSRKDFSRATELFKKALIVRPGDPTASHNLALLYLNQKNIDLARKTYNAVFEIFPDNVTTLLRLARLERRLNNLAEVLRLLEKAVAVAPQSVAARTQLARSLVESGKPAKALAITQEGLRNAPDNLALLETIGIAQLETSRYKDAVLTFARITELSPKSISAFASLARASYFAGNAPRAKSALNTILQKNPNHRDALILIIQIALLEGDFDAARTYLPRLQNIKGAESAAAEFEANLALGEKKPEMAVAALKKLAELREDTNDMLRLSELLWGLGRREETLSRMRGWLEKYPNDQLARFKLAQFYMTVAQWKEARPVLEKLLVTVPENVAALNNLAFTIFNIGDLDAALPFATRANELAPGNAAAMDTLGVILLAQGKTQEAVTILRRAAGRRSPSQASIRFHFAKALAADNRNDEAITVLTKVLDGKRRFDEIKDAEALLAKLTK